MRRRSLSLTLAAAALLASPALSSAGGVRFFASPRAPEPRRAPPEATQPDPVKIWAPAKAIVGTGDTPRDALNNALAEARDALADHLKRHYPDIDWQPTVDDLERMKIATLLGEPVEKNSDFVKRYYEASVAVLLTDQNLLQMREHCRLKRVAQRHHLAMLILAGALVVLLVLAGYLRLEEMTHGFYTGLLRLGAVALLALAGAGLWLLQ
jgi:hypothetical protein